MHSLSRRDHLRVCGADPSDLTRTPLPAGSPPRVRSRLLVSPVGGAVAGITSACAEQTRRELRRTICREDHLRVCGADEY